MSDMVTGEDIGDRLDHLTEMIEQLSRRVDGLK